MRHPDKGYIAGVCHGMGEHTGIDPILWRALVVFTGGGLFVYLALWVFLKKEESYH
jgi:phage shock protein PspC (stress-responsive transcriptional regulator)